MHFFNPKTVFQRESTDPLSGHPEVKWGLQILPSSLTLMLLQLNSKLDFDGIYFRNIGRVYSPTCIFKDMLL